MKILVIDDEERNRAAAKEQLGGKHEVTTAKSFSEMYNLLEIKEKKYDVVMTDLMMPGQQNGMTELGMRYVGEMMPTGLVCALFAAQKNVSKICVISETNHHHHPIVYDLDRIHRVGKIKFFCGMNYFAKGEENKDWARALRLITRR